MRRWDVAASERVTHYVANSAITQRRIQDFCGRDAAIVHPPVDVHRFRRPEPEDCFLTVSEVVRHKRVHVALEAARRTGQQIKVVGTGPDLPRLQREYGGTAEFLGRVSDEDLQHLYPRARASGDGQRRGVRDRRRGGSGGGPARLAADAGGARETVVEGETGHRVAVVDVGALAEAMADADLDRFDPQLMIANAHRFSRRRFQRKLRAEVAFGVGGSAPCGSDY